MISLYTGFWISRLIKKKARNSGKSQLFADNFAHFESNDSFNEITRNF